MVINNDGIVNAVINSKKIVIHELLTLKGNFCIGMGLNPTLRIYVFLFHILFHIK